MPVANQNSIKSLATPAIALICLGVIISLQLPKLHALTYRANASIDNLRKEEDLEGTQLNLLNKMPVLSFNNLAADWAFLRFLQYFGDGEARAKTGYSLSPEYFEVIVNRDPRFTEAYSFFSSASSIYAGRPDRTVALMNKGLKSLSPDSPKAFYIWLYKGTDELLFLGDTKAAQHSHKMAAQWAKASDDPDGPRIAALASKTAQFLARNPSSKQAQVSAWLMVLSNAVDNRTRQLAVDRIEALGGKVLITPQGEVRVQPPETDS